MTGSSTLGQQGTGRLRLDDNAKNFEIWVRRHGGAEPMFDLRFETFTGRGLFRTQQRSSLTSTPAGNKGESGRLDLDEVMQTSFVHVGSSRSHLTFVDDASERLCRLPTGIWLPIVLTPHGHLDVRGSEPDTPKVEKQSSVQRNSPKSAAPAERKSASDYIFELEAELAKAKEHISALKGRIENLEDQVDRLGGELSPLVLDTSPKSIETTS